MNTTRARKGTRILRFRLIALSVLSLTLCTASPSKVRKTELFTKGWHFLLGDIPNGQEPGLDDSRWRVLDLPHDWSIEGEFKAE